MTIDRATEEATIYLVHTSLAPDDLAAVPGVEDHHVVATGLILVAATSGRSRLYHDIKWAGPDDGPLVVAPLRERPKVTRVEPGTTTWIREHLPAEP